MKTQDEEKIMKLVEMVKRSYPNLQYHGAEHGIGVWCAARELARVANLGYEDKLALEVAALNHDKYVVHNRRDNEEKSARFANRYLIRLGFTEEFAERSSKLILTTKMPQNPGNYLERLLCDADLHSLGSPRFIDWSNKLRREWNREEDKDWYVLQLDFLEEHKYHTEVARNLWNKQKKENIKLMKEKLGGYNEAA